MDTVGRSNSPMPEEVGLQYASGYEARRHETGGGKLDAARTQELMRRFLPSPPALVRDVGGGPGGHACWLAREGYEVHLVDLVPLHVELARRASEDQPNHPLASIAAADARTLPWNEGTSDAVLLFGPLYHLTARTDRLVALREARRVLRNGGILLGVGISRFASVLDGLFRGFLDDPEFQRIVEGDLQNGQHRNPNQHSNYFMDTFFHHPDELRTEVEEAGFSVTGVFGVEGPGVWLQNLDDHWNNEKRRARMLKIASRLEEEPTLLGLSPHLVVAAQK